MFRIEPVRRTQTRRVILPGSLVAFVLAGRLPSRAEDKPSLEKHFSALKQDFGKKNGQRTRILSGPLAVRMLRNQSPGKVWQASLGDTVFKITIEDKVKLDVTNCLARLEKVPSSYRRAFQIVSEGKKDGVAFYADLDGAAAHGSQDYLNLVPDADAFVIVHEAGHILEQRATVSEPKTLNQWNEAIAKDKISVSGYGDSVAHEDLAEFAYIYAVCLDAGKEQLAELKKLSPQRCLIWERILQSAKAELVLKGV